jgi:hypothetical protein
MSYLHANGKKAIMMDKVEDPIVGIASIMGEKNVEAARKSIGSEVATTEYKHCIQNVKSKSIVNLYEALKEEAAEDSEYNDVKSIELIETCPLPANGACDHGDRIEYFYTGSKKLLQDQREGCEYFKKKWITFDAQVKG